MLCKGKACLTSIGIAALNGCMRKASMESFGTLEFIGDLVNAVDADGVQSVAFGFAELEHAWSKPERCRFPHHLS